MEYRLERALRSSTVIGNRSEDAGVYVTTSPLSSADLVPVCHPLRGRGGRGPRSFLLSNLHNFLSKHPSFPLSLWCFGG